MLPKQKWLYLSVRSGAKVVPGAFAGLLACAYEGNFDTCEAIPQGDPSGFLVNPLGGLSVDMAGPSRYRRIRLFFRRQSSCSSLDQAGACFEYEGPPTYAWGFVPCTYSHVRGENGALALLASLVLS